MFTSDILYDPRLSIKHARMVGITQVDENYAPMPRDMNFFLPKNKVSGNIQIFYCLSNSI